MYPNDEDTSFRLDKYDNEVLEKVKKIRFNKTFYTAYYKNRTSNYRIIFHN